MKLGFVTAIAITAMLALSSCGSEETSSIGASPESAVSREAATHEFSTFGHYFAVENQLKDWWGGSGIPITWKVSEVDDFDWDGVSRPNAAPPNGLQGLVQDPFSGSHKVRIELNADSVRFVLTPVALIDGASVELEPIEFRGIPARIATAGVVADCDMESRDIFATASLSKRTPRGLLLYDVVMDCNYNPWGAWNVTVRNYQKS